MCDPFAGFFLRNCPKRERDMRQERISLLAINRQDPTADATRRTLQDKDSLLRKRKSYGGRLLSLHPRGTWVRMMQRKVYKQLLKMPPSIISRAPTLERATRQWLARVHKICKRDRNQSKSDETYHVSLQCLRVRKNPEPALVLWRIDNDMERERRAKWGHKIVEAINDVKLRDKVRATKGRWDVSYYFVNFSIGEIAQIRE